MLPVIEHAVNALSESGWEPEIVVLLQPTSPLRTGAHIRAAVQALRDIGRRFGRDGRRAAATPVARLRHADRRGPARPVSAGGDADYQAAGHAARVRARRHGLRRSGRRTLRETRSIYGEHCHPLVVPGARVDHDRHAGRLGRGRAEARRTRHAGMTSRRRRSAGGRAQSRRQGVAPRGGCAEARRPAGAPGRTPARTGGGLRRRSGRLNARSPPSRADAGRSSPARGCRKSASRCSTGFRFCAGSRIGTGSIPSASIAVSRGGVAGWYGDLAGAIRRDLRPPLAGGVRRRNRERHQREESGGQKQTTIGPLDEELIAAGAHGDRVTRRARSAIHR